MLLRPSSLTTSESLKIPHMTSMCKSGRSLSCVFACDSLLSEIISRTRFDFIGENEFQRQLSPISYLLSDVHDKKSFIETNQCVASLFFLRRRLSRSKRSAPSMEILLMLHRSEEAPMRTRSISGGQTREQMLSDEMVMAQQTSLCTCSVQCVVY